jgi:hypothetical protein
VLAAASGDLSLSHIDRNSANLAGFNPVLNHPAAQTIPRQLEEPPSVRLSTYSDR